MRALILLPIMLTCIAAPATAQDPLIVTERAAMILNPVKPERTADFEAGLEQLRAALAATADPILKQQARGWRMYRADEPVGSNALYVFVIEPAVPFADYSFKRILGSLPTEEAEAASRRLYDSLAGPQRVFSMKTQGGPVIEKIERKPEKKQK